MDKIIDKIKKCLALAKSSNGNEAATALRQAQKLMAQHNISQADIDLAEMNAKTTRSGKARTPPKYVIYLANLICRAFGVEMIFKEKMDGCDVEFIGLGIQPEIASYAYDVLLRQLTRDRKAYMATLGNRCKTTTKTRKADIFAEHWVMQAARTVTEFVKPSNFDDMVKSYIARRHGDLVEFQPRHKKLTNKDFGSVLAGRAAGNNVQLHHGMNEQQTERLSQT